MLDAFKLGGGTTGKIVELGNIREDMFALIVEADLVIADITVHNANVFYELGIRHALRKKRSVLIKGAPVADSPAFDVLTDRYLRYNVDDPASSVGELTEVVRQTMASERETDSPIFKMLPTLSEVEPASVTQVVPTDLIEEVGRAAAAKSAGWLRLLASEVGGLRFEWPALRLIGQAQWDVEDHEGARMTFERVIGNDPDDVPSNLALSNLYERQYRKERQLEQFAASDQAIARVLARGDALTTAQRAEALALQGRNQKTLWRLSFEDLPELAARRRRASSRSLRASYEAYRKAYLTDLNHFWPGLAALQLGTVALDLANDASDWASSFETDDEAVSYAAKLKREVSELRALLPLAITAALQRLRPGNKDRVWAEMSPADLAFLVEESNQRVIQRYRDSVSKSNLFAWDAARGQLNLFSSLGFRPELAAEVLATVEADLRRPAAEETQILIFTGHIIDEPGRPDRRFPAEAVAKARSLISAHLLALKEAGPKLQVLASAAPGSDIICHEVCGERRIDSTVCLPMRHDIYSSEVFGSFNSWRSRYLDLLDKRPVLELGDRAGLPRWLSTKSGVDPWERGNRWVLEMARSGRARRVTLLALWDRREESGRPGGTAHSVQIARASGTVDVQIIDAAQLLTPLVDSTGVRPAGS